MLGDAEPDPPPVVRKPSWMPEATLHAMEQAAHRASGWNRAAEAAAAVVPDPEGWTGRRHPAGAPVAGQAEVVESLVNALRFGEDGKRNSGGNDFIAPMAAERLARHLTLSGFVVTRPPRAPPGPSPFGGSNPGRPDASP
jgi:hypothetical protein